MANYRKANYTKGPEEEIVSTGAPAMYDYSAIENDPNSTWNQLRYGGAGWKNDLKNWDSLSPEQQAAMTAVANQKGGWEDNSVYGSASSFNSNYNSGYTPGTWDGHSNVYLDALNSVMGYQPFSYDYTKDPLYKVYSDEYTRLGQQAMDDTMAKIAARTGGLASSYAATAGNQAYGNYMQELAGKIPELRNQAYNEWQGNFNNLLNKYNVANGHDTFDYGVFSDDEARKLTAYQLNQSLAQQQYENALAAAGIRAQYGDLGGYDSLLGTGLQGRYDQQQADAAEKNAIYAFSDDGGEPYRITSDKGLNWLQSLPEGIPTPGGDGSIWTRKNGQIVIEKNGKTYRYGEGYIPEPQEPVANRFQYVYDTVMNEAMYGGNMDNVRSMVAQEVANARATGSMTDDQIRTLLAMFGYKEGA